MRRAGVLTIFGAVLPLALGATVGMSTSEAGEGTLAHPMPPTAFLWLSVGLAGAHLLVLAGYLAVAGLTGGWARTLALVGALGTGAVAVVELWAGLLAEADVEGGAVAALDAAYGACSVVITVGTVGAGAALWGSRRPLALPLLVNGLLLGLVVIPVRFLGSDTAAIALLTGWGLTYAWLGVVLVRTRAEAAPGPGERGAAAAAATG